MKITDICLIREKFGVVKIFDTLQENQISTNYRLIENIWDLSKLQIYENIKSR